MFSIQCPDIARANQKHEQKQRPNSEVLLAQGPLEVCVDSVYVTMYHTTLHALSRTTSPSSLSFCWQFLCKGKSCQQGVAANQQLGQGREQVP